MVLQESKDPLDHFAARKFGVTKLKSEPTQSHFGLEPVDFVPTTMKQARGAPHPVLIMESPSWETVGVRNYRREVANVMRGVIALRDQDVPKNKGCPAITHGKELTAHKSEAFF